MMLWYMSFWERGVYGLQSIWNHGVSRLARRNLLIFAGSVAYLFLCSIPSTATPLGVTTEGTVDCGEWLAARRDNQAEAFEHYVLGFLLIGS